MHIKPFEAAGDQLTQPFETVTVPEVAVELGESLHPSKTKWFAAFAKHMHSPNFDVRQTAIDFLPDVITDRRHAYLNLNNDGKLVSLYEDLLREQPPQVLAAAARWTGLLAVRSLLNEHEEEWRMWFIGESRWPIRSWHYRTNNERSLRVGEALRKHEHETVRAVALASIDYWYDQPLIKH